MNGVFHFLVFQERVWYIRKFKIQRGDDNEQLAFNSLKRTFALSVFIATIPTHLLCQM